MDTNTLKEQVAKYTNAIEVAQQLVADLEPEAGSESEARREELMAMTQEEVVELLLKAEKVKDSGPDVSGAVKLILESPECSCLPYKTIAEIVRQALGSNTSHKSVAWYASNKKDEWSIQSRQKLSLG